jgi:hypothetical protein
LKRKGGKKKNGPQHSTKFYLHYDTILIGLINRRGKRTLGGIWWIRISSDGWGLWLFNQWWRGRTPTVFSVSASWGLQCTYHSSSALLNKGLLQSDINCHVFRKELIIWVCFARLNHICYNSTTGEIIYSWIRDMQWDAQLTIYSSIKLTEMNEIRGKK